jgi:hypothetical protein
MLIPGGVVLALIDVACIYHLSQRGGAQYWYYVIIFMPGAGALAYFVSEILPEFLGRSRVPEVVQDVVDPGRTYRKLHEEARLVDSAESKRVLAEECARKGHFGEAVEHFRAALSGIHAEDPAILIGLSESLVENGNFAEGVVELKRLETIDPRYKPAERQLLLARSLESMGEAKSAETCYRAIKDIFPGPEAKVRYAHFLYTQNRAAEARDLLQAILDQSKRLPSHARRLNRYWLDQAKTAMDQVRSA